MDGLRAALSGAASAAGSGVGWMGHEALGGAQTAAGGLADAARFMGGLSHRANVNQQAEYLAQSLRQHGVPEADAWLLGHQYARSLDVNSIPEREAAVRIALGQWRSDQARHRG